MKKTITSCTWIDMDSTNNYTLLRFDRRTKECIELTRVTSFSNVCSCDNFPVCVEPNGSVQLDYPYVKNEDGSWSPKSDRQAMINKHDTSYILGDKDSDFYIVFDCDIGSPTVTAWKLPRG